MTELPLFRWKRDCEIVPFPAGRRIGKARSVADTWLRFESEAQAQAYVNRIDRDLHRHLERLGVDESRRQAMADDFWRLVRIEIAKRPHAMTTKRRR